jgi:site-specific recombinase XerD
VDNKIGPHGLRHTAATFAQEETGDVRRVQKMMRHARIETTLLYEHAKNRLRDSAPLDTADYVTEGR